MQLKSKDNQKVPKNCSKTENSVRYIFIEPHWADTFKEKITTRYVNIYQAGIIPCIYRYEYFIIMTLGIMIDFESFRWNVKNVNLNKKRGKILVS